MSRREFVVMRVRRDGSHVPSCNAQQPAGGGEYGLADRPDALFGEVKLRCYNAAGRVGGISFFADNLIFQPNQVLPDGTLSLTYEMSRFDDVINTLRYEKPLILAVNPDTGFGYLGNAELEPVGEQEAASAMIPVLA